MASNEDLKKAQNYLNHLIELKEKDTQNIERLFNLLEEFKFIRNGNEDVKAFSTDLTKLNEQLQAEIDCSSS